LQKGQDRYQQLAASRLKTARLAAGWDQARLARGLTDVLGIPVTEQQVTDWEEGAEHFISGIMPAAYDVMAITEAEIVGLDNPDLEQINRLAIAVAKVRALLNDPTALMRRATELMEGTAKPLLGIGTFLFVSPARSLEAIGCAVVVYLTNEPSGFALWAAVTFHAPILTKLLP
jgi:transcriptional regulator with XRE-family HTH domain